MNDKTIVITGGTGGIGLQSALGLAKSGARVIITGRNATRGEEARANIADQSGNPRVELVVGDLSTRAGVDALAAALLEATDRIDVLVNNAGYLGSEMSRNEDGVEMHFAVNVVAPRRLTLALLPALRRAEGARVLNVTGGQKSGPVDVDNLQAEKGFKGLATYSHSKRAMEAMSLALAEELAAEGIYLNVIYPGVASTALTQKTTTKTLPGLWKLLYPVFKIMMREDGGKSAKKAAASTIWASTTQDLDGISGAYFDTNTKERKFHPTIYDRAVQQRVVELAAG